VKKAMRPASDNDGMVALEPEPQGFSSGVLHEKSVHAALSAANQNNSPSLPEFVSSSARQSAQRVLIGFTVEGAFYYKV
jgi:hypothetical protein